MAALSGLFVFSRQLRIQNAIDRWRRQLSRWNRKCSTNRRSQRLRPPGDLRHVVNLILSPSGAAKQQQTRQFFSAFDVEVAQCLGMHVNSAGELLRIATPALLSLALCPATLYLYEPLATVFWPPSKGFSSPPDINEAIACFLAPAGLVYATSFGFAFQQALSKQIEIMGKVAHEMGLLDQIVTLTSKLTFPDHRQRMDVYRAVKAEAIYMILQLEQKQPHDHVNVPDDDVKGQGRAWRAVVSVRVELSSLPQKWSSKHRLLINFPTKLSASARN